MSDINVPFDHSILDRGAARTLKRFIHAFPQEKIFSLENSEDYYKHKPDNDYEGGWVLQWHCPSFGEEDWNLRLHYAQESPPEFWLVLRWSNEHEHFFDREFKPDIDGCLARMEEIFAEKVWYLILFRENAKWGRGSICKPEDIDRSINEVDRHYGRVIRYEIKSWRGTYDKEVKLE